MKKLTIILLTLTMVFTLSTVAFAAENLEEDLCLTTTTFNDSNGRTYIMAPEPNTLYPVGDTEAAMMLGSDPEDLRLICSYKMIYTHERVGILNDFMVDMVMYPINATLIPTYERINNDTKIGLFVHTGTNWVKIDSTVENGTVKATLNNYVKNYQSQGNYLALILDTSTLTPKPIFINYDTFNITGVDANTDIVYGTMKKPVDRLSDVEEGPVKDFLDNNVFIGMITGADTLVNSADIILYDLMDIEMAEDTLFPVTITFEYPDINPNSKIFIMHLTDEGSWEMVPAFTEEGKITATFTSLSPVIMFADNTTLGATPPDPIDDEDEKDDDEESPVTGDGPLAYIIILVSLSLLTLAYTSVKSNN